MSSDPTTLLAGNKRPGVEKGFVVVEPTRQQEGEILLNNQKKSHKKPGEDGKYDARNLRRNYIPAACKWLRGAFPDDHDCATVTEATLQSNPVFETIRLLGSDFYARSDFSKYVQDRNWKHAVSLKLEERKPKFLQAWLTRNQNDELLSGILKLDSNDANPNVDPASSGTSPDFCMNAFLIRRFRHRPATIPLICRLRRVKLGPEFEFLDTTEECIVANTRLLALLLHQSKLFPTAVLSLIGVPYIEIPKGRGILYAIEDWCNQRCHQQDSSASEHDHLFLSLKRTPYNQDAIAHYRNLDRPVSSPDDPIWNMVEERELFVLPGAVPICHLYLKVLDRNVTLLFGHRFDTGGCPSIHVANHHYSDNDDEEPIKIVSILKTDRVVNTRDHGCISLAETGPVAFITPSCIVIVSNGGGGGGEIVDPDSIDLVLHEDSTAQWTNNKRGSCVVGAGTTEVLALGYHFNDFKSRVTIDGGRPVMALTMMEQGGGGGEDGKGLVKKWSHTAHVLGIRPSKATPLPLTSTQIQSKWGCSSEPLSERFVVAFS